MKQLCIKLIIVGVLTMQSTYADVDTQIQAIQNASIEEKFKLMNAFKKSLVQMQEQERIEAVKKLSKNSNKKQAKRVLKELEENTKRASMQKHIEHQQMTQDSINNNLDLSEGGEDND